MATGSFGFASASASTCREVVSITIRNCSKTFFCSAGVLPLWYCLKLTFSCLLNSFSRDSSFCAGVCGAGGGVFSAALSSAAWASAAPPSSKAKIHDVRIGGFQEGKGRRNQLPTLRAARGQGKQNLSVLSL